MAVLVVNLQRKLKLDTRSFKSFVESVVPRIDEAGGRGVSVAFVSDERMSELNKFFRGKEATTDVLSFPHAADEFDPNNDELGDIVISAEQAERQAEENGLRLETEIRQLILHGLLHLCGYDHETDDGEMDRRELELRERLGI